MKKLIPLLLSVSMMVMLLAGCGAPTDDANSDAGTSAKKTLTIGDTTFNPENAEPDVNPHNDYAGWACIRYGIGETLVTILIPWRSSPGWPSPGKTRMISHGSLNCRKV